MISVSIPFFFVLSLQCEGSLFALRESKSRDNGGIESKHKPDQLVSTDQSALIFSPPKCVDSEAVSFLQTHKRIWTTSNHRNQTADPLKKSRIILHHIYKTGGTHLCELAQSAGFKAPSNIRCYIEEDDTCSISSKLANTSFDVLGHECPIDVNLIDEAERNGFRVVGMLRDPSQQAVSWYLHVSQYRSALDRPLASLKEWAQYDGNHDSVSGTFNASDFGRFIPNIQTRWLAGEECRASPEKAGCIEKALRTLSRMAAVLEQDQYELHGIDKLAKLGWYPKEEHPNQTSGTDMFLSKMSAEEKSWLLGVQNIDIEMIKAARARGLI